MKTFKYHLGVKYPMLLLSIASILIGFDSPARATTIVVGMGATFFDNTAPFSTFYTGQYQQIYSASVFGQPFLISTISFQTGFDSGAQQATYDFTLSLGTTSRTPGNPGSSYSGTFTPVFSGIVPVNFTNPRSFDFNIPLSTPFLYNPALGNLLMDVVMHSATDSPPGSSLFAWSQNDPQLGRVYNSSGTGPATAGPNNGLVTSFTGATTVPDSGATVLLLGADVAAVVGVRRTLYNFGSS